MDCSPHRWTIGRKLIKASSLIHLVWLVLKKWLNKEGPREKELTFTVAIFISPFTVWSPHFEITVFSFPLPLI